METESKPCCGPGHQLAIAEHGKKQNEKKKKTCLATWPSSANQTETDSDLHLKDHRKSFFFVWLDPQGD